MRDKDETVHVASRSQSDNRLQLYVVPSTKSLECTNAEDHPRFKDLDIFGPAGVFGCEADFARGRIFGIPVNKVRTRINYVEKTDHEVIKCHSTT